MEFSSEYQTKSGGFRFALWWSVLKRKWLNCRDGFFYLFYFLQQVGRLWHEFREKAKGHISHAKQAAVISCSKLKFLLLHHRVQLFVLEYILYRYI